MPIININDHVFELHKGVPRTAQQAFPLAFLSYRDMIFESYPGYPYLRDCLFEHSFTQDITPEARDIFLPPQNQAQNGYDSDSIQTPFNSSRMVGEESVGDYADTQFLMRSIRSFEESRLVQYDADSFGEFQNEVMANPTFLMRRIPLKRNLRSRHHRMVESNLLLGDNEDRALSLNDDNVRFGFCIKEDSEYSENSEDLGPSPSYWPPRPLHKQYFLDRVNINIEPLGGWVDASNIGGWVDDAPTSYDKVNHMADALGLTDLVEEDLQQMYINPQRQQDICQIIETRYDNLPVGSLSSSSSSLLLDGMVIIGCLFILLYLGFLDRLLSFLQNWAKPQFSEAYYPLNERNPFF